jgi:hypothetical protein
MEGAEKREALKTRMLRRINRESLGILISLTKRGFESIKGKNVGKIE